MTSSITAIARSLPTVTSLSGASRSNTSRTQEQHSAWPQPKHERKGKGNMGNMGNKGNMDRKKQRVQNWYDSIIAKKDRLEEQRRRQLSSIGDSIGDIANKEWDVLTETLKDQDDSDSEEEDDFEIEEDFSEKKTHHDSGHSQPGTEGKRQH
jgi:hypothetical protein